VGGTHRSAVLPQFLTWLSQVGTMKRLKVSEYMLGLLPPIMLSTLMSGFVDHKTVLAVTNAAVILSLYYDLHIDGCRNMIG